MKYFFLFNLLIINCLIVPDTANAAHVDTLEIFSASMRKNIKCLVVAPENYRATGKPYPVLYLLHGYSGNFAGWLTDAPQIREHADNYQMIIVCPDGGYDSWYLDSPVDTTVRYETYIAKEVVGFIDYYYNTRRERAGRAIAGLSMGGHGAITLGIKHIDTFGAAGSMAGGLDLRPFKLNNWDLKGVLGEPLIHWKNWEAASAVNFVPRLKGSDFPIIIDCGLDDFFLETNREMHRRLLEADIPHEYTERPGEHNSDYWGSAVDFQVLFFHKFFEEEGRG
ncbi:MAG: alpha/beta hydrolase [Saprospiraceae bacterium]